MAYLNRIAPFRSFATSEMVTAVLGSCGECLRVQPGTGSRNRHEWGVCGAR